MASNQCSFAKCREGEDLVTRRSRRNGNVYRYCEDHDPLDSDAAFGFTEVDE